MARTKNPRDAAHSRVKKWLKHTPQPGSTTWAQTMNDLGNAENMIQQIMLLLHRPTTHLDDNDAAMIMAAIQDRRREITTEEQAQTRREHLLHDLMHMESDTEHREFCLQAMALVSDLVCMATCRRVAIMMCLHDRLGADSRGLGRLDANTVSLIARLSME